jgi:hypothetical protein
VAFSEIVTCGVDGLVRIFPTASCLPGANAQNDGVDLDFHIDQTYCLAIPAIDGLIVSSSKDHRALSYSYNEDENKWDEDDVIGRFNDSVTALAINPSGSLVAAGAGRNLHL